MGEDPSRSYADRRVSFRWLTLAGILVLSVAALTLTSRTGGAQAQESGRSVEFDIAEQPTLVSGFVVGYFVQGKAEPAFEFRVQRRGAEAVRPGVMRLALIQGPLPAGETFVMRIKTVAGRRSSDWSAPSAPFTVTEEESRTATSAAAVPIDKATAAAKGDTPASAEPTRPARRTRSALADLERRPEVRKKLTERFPGIDLGEAAADFRTVVDLGTALFVAENLKVPFANLRAAMAGPDGGLEKAIAAVRPDVNARSEIRKARSQSRQAFRPPREKDKQ